MSLRDGRNLVERKFQTQYKTFVFLKINFNLVLGKRPLGHLAYAPILMQYVAPGCKFVKSGGKISRNFSGAYEFLKVGMHT